MRPTITEIADAFSRHRFEETYPYMLDDIDWALVGENQITGKDNVVRVCEESANELTNVRTTFSKFRVITGEDCVVIDSRAEYIDSDNAISNVASCDIYDFISGNLAGITSYVFELEPNRTPG